MELKILSDAILALPLEKLLSIFPHYYTLGRDECNRWEIRHFNDLDIPLPPSREQKTGETLKEFICRFYDNLAFQENLQINHEAKEVLRIEAETNGNRQEIAMNLHGCTFDDLVYKHLEIEIFELLRK